MSEVATITLGGQQFAIPQLPLGVMRKVWPITARMAKRAKESTEAGIGFDPSEQNIDDAIELAFLGISFGKPDFTRADMESMVTDLGEVIEASLVVAIQAGGKRLGEQMAAMKIQAQAAPPAPTTEVSQTSTPLSPTSASVPGGSGTE